MENRWTANNDGEMQEKTEWPFPHGFNAWFVRRGSPASLPEETSPGIDGGESTVRRWMAG